MGGSNGHVSMAISKAYPRLNFVVQDRTAEITQWQDELPDEFVGRIKYEYHDFFTIQQTKADVYFLRYIIHNWADIDAVEIVRGLTPALETGTRLIIMEYLGPCGRNMGEFEERTYR